MEELDLKESKELMELKASKESLDQLGPKVLKDHVETKDSLELLDLSELLDLLELSELLVSLESQDPQEFKEPKDVKVELGVMELPDPKGLKELLDVKDALECRPTVSSTLIQLQQSAMDKPQEHGKQSELSLSDLSILNILKESTLNCWPERQSLLIPLLPSESALKSKLVKRAYGSPVMNPF